MELESSSVALEWRGKRMSKLGSRSGVCPCGGEPLVAHGRHLLGAICCDRVRGCARAFFGSTGRFGESLEDVVQQCYAKLATPGTLAGFVPPSGRDREDAFRAFIYVVCKRVCLSRLAVLQRQSKVCQPTPAYQREPAVAMSPEQAFARRLIVEIAQRAVAMVARRYDSRDSKSGERFDAMLQQFLAGKVDYDVLSERLGDNYQTLKTAMCELKKALVETCRQVVEDMLALAPGLDAFSVELAVDREIQELFEAAYPGDNDRLLDFFLAPEDGEEQRGDEESNR